MGQFRDVTIVAVFDIVASICSMTNQFTLTSRTDHLVSTLFPLTHQPRSLYADHAQCAGSGSIQSQIVVLRSTALCGELWLAEGEQRHKRLTNLVVTDRLWYRRWQTTCDTNSTVNCFQSILVSWRVLSDSAWWCGYNQTALNLPSKKRH